MYDLAKFAFIVLALSLLAISNESHENINFIQQGFEGVVKGKSKLVHSWLVW